MRGISAHGSYIARRIYYPLIRDPYRSNASHRRNLFVLRLQVAQDLIWVWGENGPDAGLESAVTPVPLVPVLDDTGVVDSGRVSTGAIYQRDLPYAWETFMENFLVRSPGSTLNLKKLWT